LDLEFLRVGAGTYFPTSLVRSLENDPSANFSSELRVAQSPEEKLIWSTTEEGDLYFLSEDEGQKNAADLCHLGPWTRFEGLFFVAHSSSEWVGAIRNQLREYFPRSIILEATDQQQFLKLLGSMQRVPDTVLVGPDFLVGDRPLSGEPSLLKLAPLILIENDWESGLSKNQETSAYHRVEWKTLPYLSGRIALHLGLVRPLPALIYCSPQTQILGLNLHRLKSKTARN
jgi:hypothetical protein